MKINSVWNYIQINAISKPNHNLTIPLLNRLSRRVELYKICNDSNYYYETWKTQANHIFFTCIGINLMPCNLQVYSVSKEIIPINVR